jgi:glycosyltransferase involved in cell wall biosynthesis
MSRKPCLIFSNYGLRSTAGGPSGFLAQNLVGTSSPFYHLNSHNEVQRSLGERIVRRFITHEPRQSLRKLGHEGNTAYAGWLLDARQVFITEEARKYGWIWFHDIWSMSACLDLIGPEQKIILQSHCPELPSEEVAGQGAKKCDVVWTQSAERRAFARADVCVFPNKEARVIYDPIMEKETHVEYLLSGCQQMKSRYNLPLDPKYSYLLYLGRRNTIKGFDVALEAFKRAYGKDNNLRLILIGGGDPVAHPGVLDIGRSEEAGSWLAACDYMVNSNRQSYFDLSVMEALSLGTPLIVACTTGHQFYARVNSSGIIPLPAADIELFEKAFLSNRKKRTENLQACADNRKLYRDQLSSEQYRIRLDDLLRRLLEKQPNG